MDSRAVLDRRNAGRNRPDETERPHLEALLASPAGRWLIGNLCRESRVFGMAPKDAYESGRHNLVWTEVAAKIIAHFGYEPFNELLKGKDDGK